MGRDGDVLAGRCSEIAVEREIVFTFTRSENKPGSRFLILLECRYNGQKKNGKSKTVWKRAGYARMWFERKVMKRVETSECA